MGTCFGDIISSLRCNNIRYAIDLLRDYLASSPSMGDEGELDDIERDYDLMLDYMAKGFVDPHRKAIYKGLVARANRLACNVLINTMCARNVVYVDAKAKAVVLADTNDEVKAKLESFVADIALLSLESDTVRKQKEAALYRSHNDYMQRLFCKLLVANQWTESEADFYTNLLLSPTIDTIDAQLMVSALTLAVMSVMDTYKWTTLVRVYLHATDPMVKQKALVGWCFAITNEAYFDEYCQKILHTVTQRPEVVDDMVSLQRQVVLCMNAERDKDIIEKDIMPDIIKNNNLKVGKSGFAEKEDDPIEDIFNPGAEELRIEKMEENFRKMASMQEEGIDVYFGGFSHMKRFPFFYQLANWFMPFYLQHPDIASVIDKTGFSEVMENVLGKGPFCDSDKYSFAIAFSNVFAQIPENMREMLKNSDAFGPAMSPEDRNTDNYRRRMILQDLYRFARLYPDKKAFRTPFNDEDCCFLANSLLQDTPVKKHYADLGFFCLKHESMRCLSTIIDVKSSEDDNRLDYLRIIYYMDYNDEDALAIKFIDKLLQKEPTNARLLTLKGRACFHCGRIEESIDAYRKLMKLKANDSKVELSLAVSLSKGQYYDEAARILYKLSFENSEDLNVIRALAWNLMGQNKLEQAANEYEELVETDLVLSIDLLHAGYCQWFMGNMSAAIKLFKRYLAKCKATKRNLTAEFVNDREMLEKHGIDEIDTNLMLDLMEHSTGDNTTDK